MTRDFVGGSVLVGLGTLFFVICLIALIVAAVIDWRRSRKKVDNAWELLDEFKDEYKGVCPCGWESEYFSSVEEANRILAGHTMVEHQS